MAFFEDSATERRLKKLEERVSNLASSVNVLSDVIKKLAEERNAASREREQLLVANKRLLALIPKENALPKQIFEKFVAPAFKEGGAAVKIATNSGISSLFEEVADKGTVNIGKFARRAGIHEAQAEEWAKFLEDNGLAKIEYEHNRAVRVVKAF
ncbi:MAG: hypothetical protein HY365_01785 [Candidatus Aenigmarchaeota archaeon]|nr:hypothetical protein [Candidatus Aenigmarchaeota archaeon]